MVISKNILCSRSRRITSLQASPRISSLMKAQLTMEIVCLSNGSSTFLQRTNATNSSSFMPLVQHPLSINLSIRVTTFQQHTHLVEVHRGLMTLDFSPPLKITTKYHQMNISKHSTSFRQHTIPFSSRVRATHYRPFLTADTSFTSQSHVPQRP